MAVMMTTLESGDELEKLKLSKIQIYLEEHGVYVCEDRNQRAWARLDEGAVVVDLGKFVECFCRLSQTGKALNSVKVHLNRVNGDYQRPVYILPGDDLLIDERGIRHKTNPPRIIGWSMVRCLENHLGEMSYPQEWTYQDGGYDDAG